MNTFLASALLVGLMALSAPGGAAVNSDTPAVDVEVSAYRIDMTVHAGGERVYQNVLTVAGVAPTAFSSITRYPVLASCEKAVLNRTPCTPEAVEVGVKGFLLPQRSGLVLLSLTGRDVVELDVHDSTPTAFLDLVRVEEATQDFMLHTGENTFRMGRYTIDATVIALN